MYGVAGYGGDNANGGILFVIKDISILKFYMTFIFFYEPMC